MKMTYFGHSAFRIDTGRSVILIDPFLTGNPHFHGDVAKATEGVTHILLSHGHSDHVGDTIDVAKRTGAKVVGTFELVQWLKSKGVETIEPANTGGTVKFDDFSVTLTQAFHSSASIEEGGKITYLGMPNGLVLHFNDGNSVYHMGDTDIFGDMALIEELASAEDRPRADRRPADDGRRGRGTRLPPLLQLQDHHPAALGNHADPRCRPAPLPGSDGGRGLARADAGDRPALRHLTQGPMDRRRRCLRATPSI